MPGEHVSLLNTASRFKMNDKFETYKIELKGKQERSSIISNAETDNGIDDSDSSGDEFDEKDISKFEELIEWIQTKRSYQNTKAWFRWLLDYAFIENRVSVRNN